jgi:hypothetical protein
MMRGFIHSRCFQSNIGRIDLVGGVRKKKLLRENDWGPELRKS